MQVYTHIDRAVLAQAFDRTERFVQDGRVTTAVLVVASANEILQSGAYTCDNTHVDCDSIFPLASITKPILALAVLQLVEAGVLDLSQPINRYLPEFDDPDKATITAWHLLTHTSGIEEIDWQSAVQHYPQRIVSFSAACQAKTLFPPGSQINYSTLTFYILAELVTRLGGEVYPVFLSNHIFKPLQMHTTSFDPREKVERAVPVLGISGGQALTQQEATNFFISFAMPGAGLWSSANDVTRLGQALLQTYQWQRHNLLSPAFLDLMTRDHTGSRKHAATGAYGAHYGLGWRKGHWTGYQTIPASPNVFEHDGAGGLLWIDPDNNLVVVYLTNNFAADSSVRNGALQCVYRALR